MKKPHGAKKISVFFNNNENVLNEWMSWWDLAYCLERLTASAEVATVQGSITAPFDTVEAEGRQMKQCWIQYIEKKY